MSGIGRGRGRPPKNDGNSPAIRQRERNAKRIYLGDLAPKWVELKSVLKFTDYQLAEHLLNNHGLTCLCNSKPVLPSPEMIDDPWDRAPQQQCLQLPSVSTPQKNRDLDIVSNVADLSLISMPSSPTSDIQTEDVPTSCNEQFGDLTDHNLTSPLEDLIDPANMTSATLGESIDSISSQDDFLNISLPDMDDNEPVPGLDSGEEFLDSISSKKCIALVDSLVELVKRSTGLECQQCQKSLVFRSRMVATALVVTWNCPKGHSGQWCSQPKIKSVFTGNLQLAADILLTGNCFSKIDMLFSFMNLGCISKSFFYNVQRYYSLPAIETYWTSMLLDILTKLQKNEPHIVLAGDGRNDSPGHTAQYCTYTMMEVNTRQIVSLEIVDLREAPNSVAMEKIGFLRCMDQVSKTVSIAEVVTDQSSTIAKTMRTSFPDINHQWDVWHAAKNLEKKLTNLGNTKKTAILSTWAPSIRNHFWYSSKICEGNEDLLKETWMRILHHVCNKHEWAISELTEGRCAHAPLNDDDDKKPWFDSESESMDILREVVMDRRLMKGMVHFTNFRHTGSLEVFHNHLLMYCPKRQSYQFPGYRARNLLAAIDFNHHLHRPELLDENGDARQKPRYSKRAKNWSTKPRKIDKGYSYKYDLQCMIFLEKAKDPLPTNRKAQPREDDPRRIARSISKIPRPATSELLARQKSRF